MPYLVLTLEETFQAVRRAAAEIRVRTGFSRSGDLIFQDLQSDFLIGACADIAERVMTKAAIVGAIKAFKQIPLGTSK